MPEEQEIKVDVAAIAKQAAEEAVKAYRAQLEAEPPAQKAAGQIEGRVTHDEADTPFPDLAAQFRAVKGYAKSLGSNYPPRLKALKAIAGASETVSADGGFLLDPTLTGEIIKPMHEEGPFSSRARKLPVSANSNYGWINGVDETSRATGSRWGGIRGYRVGEGVTITASKPKFRRINWELQKYALLIYGTDELLMDAAQFSSVVQQGAREELSFMLNDDILNGLGAGGPLGILASPALYSVPKEGGQLAATVSYRNLSDMWMGLDTRSKRSPVTAWFINAEVTPFLDEMYINAGTGGIPPRFISETPNGTYTIKGRPVIETEFNAAVGTLGDIVLSDMSEYLVWQKGDVQFASSIHVEFLTDQEIFRMIVRVDGKPTMNSTITPYKATSGRVMSAHVALAARA